MGRYRELKSQGLSGLEASHQTRVEFEAGFVPTNVPVTDVPTEMSPPVQVCADCRVQPPEAGRSVCAACRKRAYRERSK